MQSFKNALRKIQGGSLQSRLTQFLFRYRLTPHTTTGYSPAEMLMGRRPRSHLDLLHPDIGKKLKNININKYLVPLTESLVFLRAEIKISQ